VLNTATFFVARRILKADAQKVARFEHLAARLRKARLVAVERRDCGDAR
jgi:hypothetical protein